MGLFDVTDAAMGVVLQATELRQNVLSNNIANANTPNFKPSDVSFQSALAQAIDYSPNSEATVAGVQPSVSTDQSQMRADGSGTDVDRSATDLAETQILYDTAMAIETSRLHTMSSIITSAH